MDGCKMIENDCYVLLAWKTRVCVCERERARFLLERFPTSKEKIFAWFSQLD